MIGTEDRSGIKRAFTKDLKPFPFDPYINGVSEIIYLAIVHPVHRAVYGNVVFRTERAARGNEFSWTGLL